MDRRVNSFGTIVLLSLLCGTGRVVAGPAEEEFTVAAGHYQARRWGLAAESFEEFRELFPDHQLVDDAQFYQAEALCQLGQFKDAIRLLDEVIDSEISTARLKHAKFRRGEAAYLARDYVQARPFLREFCESYPGDSLRAYALTYLGDTHAIADDAAAARKAYDSCLQEFPDGPLASSCTRGLARALVALGEFESVVSLLSPLRNDPELGLDACYWMCLALHEQQKYAEAVTLIQVALPPPTEAHDLETLEALARLLLAECHHALGESSLADEQYERVFLGAQDNGLRERALYGRLRLAAEVEQPARIERLAREFLQEFPDSSLGPQVHAALGQARLGQNDYADAKEQFQKALADGRVPASVAARCHAGLAVCHVATGHTREAIEDLNVLTERYAQYWDVFATTYRVAEMAYASGARSEAAELFARVAEAAQSPSLAANALAGLAWSQLRQEELLASAESFERLLEKYPDDPRAAQAGLLRAQLLERQGNHDAALATYRRVVERFDDPMVLPTALYRAARLHDRLKQATEARRVYRELVEKFPGHEHAPAAMYHLAWLSREAADEAAAKSAWQAIHDRGSGSSYWNEATYLLAVDAAEHADHARASTLNQSLLESLGSTPDDDRSTTPHESSMSVDDLLARSLMLAAQLAMDADQWDEARGYLARIVAECSDDELCLAADFWIAEADYRLNRFDDAGERLERLQSDVAGRQAEWAPLVFLRRAQILAHDQQWTAALNAAQQVIDRYPEFALVHVAEYVRGRSLAAQADFEEARKAYQNVLGSAASAGTETAAMAQWMIGESYMHQEDYEAALRAYLRVEILFTFPEWQARALLQAGKCYELLDQWDHAQATYSRAVNRFPRSSVIDEIRTRLELVTRRWASRSASKETNAVRSNSRQ